MNDEFLYRLRIPPPPSFAARLKLRLDALASVQAHRRTYRRLYMVAGLFIAGTALALVSPSVRNYAIEWFGSEVRNDDTASTQPAPPTKAPTDTTVSPFVGRGVPRDESAVIVGATNGDISGEPLASNNPFARAGGSGASVDESVATAPPSLQEETAGGALRPPAFITLDGSRTVAPLTDSVVATFQQRSGKRTRFVTDHGEAGPAFGKFCRREIDLVHSVRPIEQTERATCTSLGTEYLELPVAYEALAVVMSPRNDWVTAMSRQDLRKIDRGGAWNSIDPAWPARRWRLFGLGREAGADWYSPDAMLPGWSRGAGITTANVQALVSRVAADAHAIGYLPFIDFEANDGKLKAVAIVNSQGVAVAASRRSIEDATYELSRPIFLYVNANSADRPEVEEFIEFYLQQGAGPIRDAKFTPLAPVASRKALQNFRDRKIGTVFADQPVRVPVAQMLAREAKRYSL